MNTRRIFSGVTGYAAGLVAGIAVLAAAGAASAQNRVIDVDNAQELQRLLSEPLENTTIRLAAGEYHLTPSADADETCGNCEDPAHTVPITAGQRISGRSVWIEGPPGAGAIIYTHAGYGLYFVDCESCRLSNVTVTGGERDTSSEATDAAVVVRRGKLYVTRCVIRDNIGDPALIEKNIVGIIGVCGREGSDLTVMECDILRNSWDGIALYRDAKGRIFSNLIDGVDRATGKTAGGGRGVGVGLTWNAWARVEKNLVRRYWKGIGVFVDAQAQIVNNIVEEMATWGIACWDAGKGKPSAAIGGNVVYDCGACGVSITRSAPLEGGDFLSFTQNVVVRTGQNPKYDSPESYCRQCALSVEAAPDGFRVDNNAFYDNRRASDDLPNYDLTAEEYDTASRRTITTIISPPESYVARAVFVESSFLKRMGR